MIELFASYLIWDFLQDQKYLIVMLKKYVLF